jgi:hypothetical protein
MVRPRNDHLRRIDRQKRHNVFENLVERVTNAESENEQRLLLNYILSVISMLFLFTDQV